MNPGMGRDYSARRLERMVCLGVCLALAALGFYLLDRSVQSQRAAAVTEAALQTELSKTRAQVVELTVTNRELQGRLTMANLRLERRSSEPLSLLSGADLATLEAQGLREPVAALVEALQRQVDLLPGTAPAFGPPEAWVISRHWIVVPYHAGDGGGHAVFRFSVAGGEIAFTRVYLAEH